MLQDWKAVCNAAAKPSSSQQTVVRNSWYDQGAFILAKTEWFTAQCEVHIGETLGLLSVLDWVHELNL
ncbi:flavonoid glycosyltransferase, partial [Trifolium pratense]